jgi:hypothetical protein
MVALGTCTNQLVHWGGVAAGAAVALGAIGLLRCAAGKPALQALAASLMAVGLIVAKWIWGCTPACSVLACVPLVLAGKCWL